MVSELDIWRAANLLIRQHWADAGLEAAKNADRMLAPAATTKGGPYGRGSGGRSKRYNRPPLARCTRVCGCLF